MKSMERHWNFIEISSHCEDLEDLRLEKEKLEDGEKQPLQEGYHEAGMTVFKAFGP